MYKIELFSVNQNKMQEFVCVQNVYVYAQAEITDWKSKLVIHL